MSERNARKSKKSDNSDERLSVNWARANETFVVSEMRRKGLAEDLNEVITAAKDAVKRGDTSPTEKSVASVARFSPDDSRLTGNVCQSYADALFDAPPDGTDDFLEWRSGYLAKLVLKISRKRPRSGSGKKSTGSKRKPAVKTRGTR